MREARLEVKRKEDQNRRLPLPCIPLPRVPSATAVPRLFSIPRLECISKEEKKGGRKKEEWEEGMKRQKKERRDRNGIRGGNYLLTKYRKEDLKKVIFLFWK